MKIIYESTTHKMNTPTSVNCRCIEKVTNFMVCFQGKLLIKVFPLIFTKFSSQLKNSALLTKAGV